MIPYYDNQLNQSRILSPGIYLMSRPKVSGVGRHFGIALVDGSWHDAMFELNDRGYREVHFAEFSAGREVLIEEGKPLSEWPQIVSRLREHIAQYPQYNVHSNNCEHAAKRIFRGVRESGQADLLGIFLVVGVAFVAAYAFRAA